MGSFYDINSDKVIMRNPKNAFKNAIDDLGKMKIDSKNSNPNDYMYMYSKTYWENDTTYDVFKHTNSRRHIVIQVEENK